jgi:uncharacterized protein (DUF1778 family)
MTLNKAGKAQKRERLEARIPEDQKQLLMNAARISGKSLSEFVISAAAESARDIVERHNMLTLSARDCEAFASALLEDVEPSDKLKQAARDWSEYMD